MENVPDYVQNLSDKEKIVRYFILNSPPGQVWSIIEDCQQLLSDSSGMEISREKLHSMLEEYNEKYFSIINLKSSDSSVVICNAAKISDNEYIVPQSKKVVTVDHILLEIDKESDLSSYSGSSAYELSSPFRDELQEKFEKYVNKFYLEDTDSVQFHNYRNLSPRHFGWAVYEKNAVTSKNEEKMHCITIVISVQKINLNNFWIGYWKSEWHINFSESDQSSILHGDIDVLTHYFEDGNIQTSHKKRFETQITDLNSPEKFALQILEFVQKNESAHFEDIRLKNMGFVDDTLKKFRRTIPVNKQKFDWTLQTLSMNADMANNALFLNRKSNS